MAFHCQPKHSQGRPGCEEIRQRCLLSQEGVKWGCSFVEVSACWRDPCRGGFEGFSSRGRQAVVRVNQDVLFHAAHCTDEDFHGLLGEPMEVDVVTTLALSDDA